jgi:hypothetical protein
LESQKANGDISTYAQLLSVRTLEFGDQYHAYDKFKDSTSKSLEMLVFKNRLKSKWFLAFLLDVILKELEKGGEIAYYNPSFGYGGHARRCIFC